MATMTTLTTTTSPRTTSPGMTMRSRMTIRITGVVVMVMATATPTQDHLQQKSAMTGTMTTRIATATNRKAAFGGSVPGHIANCEGSHGV